MNVWVPALTLPLITGNTSLGTVGPQTRQKALRQGQGLLPEVAALPSEVQEVGVSEASSGPDCLGGAGQWRVRGLAAAAPSSPASRQLGGLDVWAGKWGWGWVPWAPTGDQLSEPED